MALSERTKMQASKIGWKHFALALTERREDHVCRPNVSLQVVIVLALTSSVHGRWLGR